MILRRVLGASATAAVLSVVLGVGAFASPGGDARISPSADVTDEIPLPDEVFAPAPGSTLRIPDVPVGWAAGDLASLPPDQLAGVARTQALSPTFDELGALDGFVQGGFASREGTDMLFYWHGRLSARALDIIRAANKRGFLVRVIHARYDPRALIVASAPLSRAFANAGLDFVCLSPGPRFANLETGMVDANSCRTRNEMRKVAFGVIGTIPLTFVTDDMQDVVPLTSSWTDPSPGDTAGIAAPPSTVRWYGQADGPGNACTTDPAVWSAGVITGSQRHAATSTPMGDGSALRATGRSAAFGPIRIPATPGWDSARTATCRGARTAPATSEHSACTAGMRH